MDEIEFLPLEHKKIPIFTKIILGKLFDYKYVKKQNLKSIIFKFTIEIKDELKDTVILSYLRKEKLFDNNFNLYEELEKELKFISKKEKIEEDLEDFKWNVEYYPMYPNGSMYLVRLILKKELKLDISLLSQKNQFNNYLNNKLSNKNIKNKLNKI